MSKKNKEYVLSKNHTADVVGIRGLKLYIVEARNHAGYIYGAGYGTTPTLAWADAAERMKSKTSNHE